jgi:hypothetical protein
MLLLLAVVLLLMWLLGFGVYHTASFAIHLLLIVAVIAVVLHFVRAATGGPRTI